MKREQQLTQSRTRVSCKLASLGCTVGILNNGLASSKWAAQSNKIKEKGKEKREKGKSCLAEEKVMNKSDLILHFLWR